MSIDVNRRNLLVAGAAAMVMAGPTLAQNAPTQSTAAAPADTSGVPNNEKRLNIVTLRDLEAGYSILAAGSGAAALEIIGRRDDIDLLFTDIVMPGGMNGRQLADEAIRQRPALKVLFTTGYTANAIVHHGRLDPDVELISKPFTYESLGRKIRALLDNKPN
jgi:CheY-like chemotaxis protein